MEKGRESSEECFTGMLRLMPLVSAQRRSCTHCPAALQSSLHWASDLGSFWKREPLLRCKKRIPGNAGGLRGIEILGWD